MLNKLKLNVQVSIEVMLLVAVTLSILAYFSHKALRQEALRNVEQTLEGTMQDIDNILLSTEQSTGNFFYYISEHLDNPERMYTYSRALVESNPNIIGCAIAFKPAYYPGRDLFMAYVHRKSSATDSPSGLVMSETFANRPYTEQSWFIETMKTGEIGWTDPLKGTATENEPMVAFCLPLTNKTGERVGVLSVDVSINQLSKIIQAAKPSENGYSVLLARNGSYIVHPDKEKLSNPAVFSQMEEDADPSEVEAAKAMLAGKSGMKEFRRGNRDWCVFFKPFERAEWEGRTNKNVGWSVGVVCPEEDIFGTHNILIYLAAAIAIASMLLFYQLFKWILRRQLKPLKQLALSAHRIAEGNYQEKLPYSDRQDEIGLLQNRFEQMQQSLQTQLNDLEEDTVQLQRHNDMLHSSYEKTVETDELKTSVLQYMTNRMSGAAENIDKSVTTLCNNRYDTSQNEIKRQVDNIQRKTQTMVELLNHMAHFTETNTGKEAPHD